MSKTCRKPNRKTANTSPRGYLSWSQLNVWEKDPNEYYNIYVEGLDHIGSKYIEVGKRMAEALEHGHDKEHDPTYETLGVFLPHYPKREFEIRASLDGIPLLGKLDGFDPKTLTIGEYKTGKNWTQAMVNSSGQLTFYALLVWLKYKKLPGGILLHWARTDEDFAGELFLTGETRDFTTRRALADIIVFTKRVKAAWKGICEIGAFAKQARK